MGGTEILGIFSKLIELGVQLGGLPTLMCDNINILYITRNPIEHAWTKHIEQCRNKLMVLTRP